MESNDFSFFDEMINSSSQKRSEDNKDKPGFESKPSYGITQKDLTFSAFYLSNALLSILLKKGIISYDEINEIASLIEEEFNEFREGGGYTD